MKEVSRDRDVEAEAKLRIKMREGRNDTELQGNRVDSRSGNVINVLSQVDEGRIRKSGVRREVGAAENKMGGRGRRISRGDGTGTRKRLVAIERTSPADMIGQE